MDGELPTGLRPRGYPLLFQPQVPAHTLRKFVGMCRYQLMYPSSDHTLTNTFPLDMYTDPPSAGHTMMGPAWVLEAASGLFGQVILGPRVRSENGASLALNSSLREKGQSKNF